MCTYRVKRVGGALTARFYPGPRLSHRFVHCRHAAGCQFTVPSPFLGLPEAEWLCANDLAFAIFDSFPVSPGHVLVITRRVVPTYFDCTAGEQAAVMDLVGEVKRLLDERLEPKPDGYNVGFNAGAAAGQTVPHVHVHVIPRYAGDMPDPRGGVRHVIPEKGNYLAPEKGDSHHLPRQRGRKDSSPPRRRQPPSNTTGRAAGEPASANLFPSSRGEIGRETRHEDANAPWSGRIG
jgi:diadenosine tetraphosphate (Ap4A) HIT family hydrolase